MRKQHLNPSVASDPEGNYSQLVKVDVGDATFLYLAGQVAEDRDGNPVGGTDMTQQAERIYENVAAILDTEDASLADVNSATTENTDMAQRAAVSAVRRKYFPVNPPATTLVEVSAIAATEYLIEVDINAVIPRASS